jgi:hypothetical protein
VVVLPAAALAERDTTRGALQRLEETLTIRVEDSTLLIKDLAPIMVVSVAPAFEETKASYPTAALATLVRIFGASSLRSCEACMTPRVYIESGLVEEQTTNLGVAEIIRMDEATRGSSPAAKVAVWLDETADGVSFRMIDLRNAQILFADNYDSKLKQALRTQKNVGLAQELERRSKGESITHTFIDIGIFPGPHFSMDWSEQWGDTNCNLSGATLSLFDPFLGVGANYFRVIPQVLNLMVGVKLLLSVPTGLIRSIGSDSQLFDPLVTGVLMVRLPIFRSNYGVILSISTNGRVGVGVSLMNFSLLPFLP